MTGESSIERERARFATREHGRSLGPLAPTSEAQLRLSPLDYDAAALNSDGFLGRWQALNRSRRSTICLARLEASGNLDNLRRLRQPERGGFRGRWFADSDIYKTLEAIGWETGRAGDRGWSGFVDETVALLREVQEADGYLNSWIQGVEPERRWRRLEWSHELYCAGHLIQAAVAVARGADRDDVLDVARRFADLAVERFGAEGGDPGSTAIPRSRRRSWSCTAKRATGAISNSRRA